MKKYKNIQFYSLALSAAVLDTLSNCIPDDGFWFSFENGGGAPFALGESVLEIILKETLHKQGQFFNSFFRIISKMCHLRK